MLKTDDYKALLLLINSDQELSVLFDKYIIDKYISKTAKISDGHEKRFTIGAAYKALTKSNGTNLSVEKKTILILEHAITTDATFVKTIRSRLGIVAAQGAVCFRMAKQLSEIEQHGKKRKAISC